MREATITLEYPITVEKQEYKTLTLRSPKARDQIVAQKAGGTNGEQEATLFSNLCEVPKAVIEELEMADYNKLQAKYKDFLS